MKKFAMAGVLFLIVGAVIFMVAFASGGWNIKALSTRPERLEKTYETEAGLKSIAIQERNGNIRIEPSPDERVHIVYYESDVEYYEISEEGGALAFTHRDSRKFYQRIFDIGFQKVTMVVRLPESFRGEMTLRDSNGGIEVGSVCVARAEIEANNGAIRANGLSAASLRLEADNGKIVAESVSVSGDLYARCANGKIEVERAEAGGELRLRADNGTLTVRNASSNSAQIISNNGAVRLEGLSVADALEVKADNGAIWLEALEIGRSCSLRADNGRIQGTLPGKTVDYTIESRADNGKNSIPEKLNGGEKQLTVITKNGNIDLSFAGEKN